MTPDPLARPAIRPFLSAARDGGRVVLFDPRQVTGPAVSLSPAEFDAVQLFDGRRSLADVQAAVARERGDLLLLPQLAGVCDRLEASAFVLGPTLAAYLEGPVRNPSCVGCYPDDVGGIHAQMRGLFTADGGPGEPASRERERPEGGDIRAALVPHMDYARGGVTYGWGFKEIAERTRARLFVVIATSHYSPERFTLTRMNFRTPLGTVPTDQAYVDRIASHYGDGLFDDALAHLPEHSIELEVVVLQHLLGGDGFRIVPLLVGSFHDCVQSGTAPIESPDVARMVAALKAAERDAGEPVCYVVSGDLAHIGPKFRDPQPVNEPQLADSRRQDERLLAELERADADAYFRVIAEEGDRRRICGLPPTYLALKAAGPRAGRPLHYQQYVHPAGRESVSFAAVAFD